MCQRMPLRSRIQGPVILSIQTRVADTAVAAVDQEEDVEAAAVLLLLGAGMVVVHPVGRAAATAPLRGDEVCLFVQCNC